MEALSESTWDVVICGTGLQQSMLALALSRSGKKILHVDPNKYYGGPDAALSLQELEGWAAAHSSSDEQQAGQAVFSNSRIIRNDGAGKTKKKLSFPRAYSLALSPQIIYTRSELLAQLVSSKAFSQVEFQAVGSFYIFRPASTAAAAAAEEEEEEGEEVGSEEGQQEQGQRQRQKPSLARIPSTREDVFSTTAIPSRSKRHLMKFLKFVIDYEAEEQSGTWKPNADEPLAEFLRSQFKLNEELIGYILALTLRLDAPNVSTREGLAVIRRHLTSMGMFGPGFAAVYPKWGGMGEIAQVACRAQAVGGGVYVLGTGVRGTKVPNAAKYEEVEVELSSDTVVKTRLLVQGAGDNMATDGQKMSRLVAIVSSPLDSLFETVVEGAPLPVVAVVAFTQGSVPSPEGSSFEQPILTTVHSSDTGECPAGQSVIYLSTLSCPGASEALDSALSSLLEATAEEGEGAECLFKVVYEQLVSSGTPIDEGRTFTFPPSPAAIAYEDDVLSQVRRAWEKAMGASTKDEEVEYMVFADREAIGDDDVGS